MPVPLESHAPYTVLGDPVSAETFNVVVILSKLVGLGFVFVIASALFSALGLPVVWPAIVATILVDLGWDLIVFSRSRQAPPPGYETVPAIFGAVTKRWFTVLGLWWVIDAVPYAGTKTFVIWGLASGGMMSIAGEAGRTVERLCRRSAI